VTNSTRHIGAKTSEIYLRTSHLMWCNVKIPEVATLVSMSRTSGAVLRSPQPNCTFVSSWRVTCGGNALFFRLLLSLCYIINTWSYSSHLHHMLLRSSSENVLISRFVERKSRKRDCSV